MHRQYKEGKVVTPALSRRSMLASAAAALFGLWKAVAGCGIAPAADSSKGVQAAGIAFPARCWSYDVGEYELSCEIRTGGQIAVTTYDSLGRVICTRKC
jgi:hypothetical protein